MLEILSGYSIGWQVLLMHVISRQDVRTEYSDISHTGTLPYLKIILKIPITYL
jgi:hypothetical protein